jgi:hypothetical protein
VGTWIGVGCAGSPSAGLLCPPVFCRFLAVLVDHSGAFAGVEVEGVEVLAVELDGEVQVGAGGVAAVADFGDGLSGSNIGLCT